MPSPNHPHCYEITSFLSMFDHYRATGNSTWLQAVSTDITHSTPLQVDACLSVTALTTVPRISRDRHRGRGKSSSPTSSILTAQAH